MERYREKVHFDRIRESAAECTVLLKSDGSFPLDRPGEIAAFGRGVRYTVTGGTGSGEVNIRTSVNIEEGLKAAGFTVTSGEWLDAYDQVLQDSRKKFVKKIQNEAFALGENIMIYCLGKIMPEPDHDLVPEGEGDTAIYVVSRISGEGNDLKPAKGDIKLADSEIRDILTLNRKYKKFMLVLNVGGVIDLSPVEEVSNILLLSQLGGTTGHVLADILLGKQNPSGKLTTTWSAFEDYCSIGSFGEKDDTEYREGIYVGYRYFDTIGILPEFPFGYGLSYTDFRIEMSDVSSCGDEITVKANVENTGKMPGKEVVQIYVSCPAGKLDKPYQELAAFEKSRSLDPGESEELELRFRLRDMASYDEDIAAYILEQGIYAIGMGNSSENTQIIAAAKLDVNAVVLKARNVTGTPGFNDHIPESAEKRIVPDGTPTLCITAGDIETCSVDYEPEYPVDDIISSLSDEELAFMSVGGFAPSQADLQVVGNAATHVAGAAGETTSILRAKGIEPLIMADGPAGLRIAKEYFTDENGAHDASATTIPASMLEFLEGLPGIDLTQLTAGGQIPEDAEILEQYATAIPIGTAIAQSFNLGLAESYGDIVGAEMEEFGVHLWLAPALNIHRSIQCGRNFEYYSEDPVLSGKMAAAVTRGIQKHPGCGTTIKHYAANNQETNRYANNSHVSERAMREIYLKAFGICVRESHPKALMTSYNLLNGIHTSEHRGLTEEILRNEFGFEGIVMTDWIISLVVPVNSKYPAAHAVPTASAGGDLFMPGGQAEYDEILQALKDGTLSRSQLEINATRVFRAANELVHKRDRR